MSITSQREIRILKDLGHPNIVKIHGLCHGPGSRLAPNSFRFYLILEYCLADLSRIIRQEKKILEPSCIRTISKQLLTAVSFMHQKGVIHRDLKLSNLLIGRDGKLKICDFGLSRYECVSLEPSVPVQYTGRVVTRWYRAPEILLGDRSHGKPVDMWSIGCIMAELFMRRPLLIGESKQEQLKMILELCGRMTPQTWPGIEKLPGYASKSSTYWEGPSKIQHTLFSICGCATDIIAGCLTCNPAKRLTAEEALKNPYFEGPGGGVSASRATAAENTINQQQINQADKNDRGAAQTPNSIHDSTRVLSENPDTNWDSTRPRQRRL